MKKNLARFFYTAITCLVFVLSLKPAEAFIMHDQEWIQLLIRYGFDFEQGSESTRIGIEVDYSFGNNYLFGWTLETEIFENYKCCISGGTFNIGYVIDPSLGDSIGIPLYTKFGLIKEKAGIVLAGGVQALINGNLNVNLDLDALATYRIILDKDGGCLVFNPVYTYGMDFGLGYAGVDSGSSSGSTTTTTTTYYYY